MFSMMSDIIALFLSTFRVKGLDFRFFVCRIYQRITTRIDVVRRGDNSCIWFKDKGFGIRLLVPRCSSKDLECTD